MFLGRQDTSPSHTVLLPVAKAKFWVCARESWGLPWSLSGKESACNAEMQDTRVQSLEEGMATHSSFLAWRMSKDRGAWRTKSIGQQRVGHDWSDFTHTQGTVEGWLPLLLN